MILKRGDAVASPESSTRSFRRDPQHAGPRSSAVTAEAASRQPDCEFKRGGCLETRAALPPIRAPLLRTGFQAVPSTGNGKVYNSSRVRFRRSAIWTPPRILPGAPLGARRSRSGPGVLREPRKTSTAQVYARWVRPVKQLSGMRTPKMPPQPPSVRTTWPMSGSTPSTSASVSTIS